MSKNLKLTIIFIAFILVGGLIWYYKGKANTKAINSYEECAAAGYPIQESYPERCNTPDGRTFTRVVTTQEGWQEQTIDEIGLSFSYPSDLTFRKEIGDNAGNIRTVAFYLEKGDPNNPEYQLYALYLADKESSAQDLEKTKIGMDPASIRETSIDGYSGIEGIANPNDPKRHYTTIVLKDDRLFSVSTYPPTTENKQLTDTIMESFDFR